MGIIQHGAKDQPEGQEQEQLLVPEQSKPEIQFFCEEASR